MVNCGGQGNKRGGNYMGWNIQGGQGLPNMARQQIMFNGIDALDPNQSFTRDEWEQLCNNGHVYVAQEQERVTTGHGRMGGCNDGMGGQAGAGQVVNEVIVQHRDGDMSTVMSRGGESGAGFGIGAHQAVSSQD
jgi:hypothetical protein